MAFKDLFFSITAEDKTANAFKAVNGKLRETAGLSAKASERIEGMGKAMAKVGAVGSVASAGILAAFRGSIGLYDEQARAEAKVAQAIKATGGAAGFTAAELRGAAKELQGITRFGDERILNEVTAQLLTFKNISGGVFMGAQTAALDLSTVLDTDLKSSAIMLGKALNAPVAGVSALSEAGVTFTAAQKDMIKGMVEAGDLLGAQTLILDEISSAYGGQAKAARRAGAGIVDAWRNSWAGVKEIVGREMLSALRVVVPALESMTAAFEALSPSGQRLVVVLGAMAVVVPPVLAAVGALVIGLSALSAPVIAVVAGIAVVTAGLVALWPEVQATVGWVGDKLSAALELARAAFGALPQPVQDVLTILAAIANPLTLLVVGVDEVKAAFARTFGAIPKLVSAAGDAIAGYISEKFNAALDSLGAKVDWVEGKFAWLYDKVVGNSWVPDLIDAVGEHFGRLTGAMVAPTDKAAGSVSDTFSGLMADVGSRLGDLAADGKLTWQGFLGSLLDVGKSYADRIISDVFDRLGHGLQGALSAVGLGSGSGGIGGAGGFVGSLLGGVGSWAKGLLGFASGGEFTVAGRGGVDRNVAAVRLSEGERVHVERKGEGGAAMRPINVYIQTPSPEAFRASRAQLGAQIGRAVMAGQRAA